MKKLLLLFFIWIYPVFSFGAVDEYLIDVYYANGILTSPRSAIYNLNFRT